MTCLGKSTIVKENYLFFQHRWQAKFVRQKDIIMKTLFFIIQWALQIFIAYFLFQNSYVKLSSSEGAVKLFTMLGMEPWGRFLMGGLEFLTALLILYPRTRVFGAVLGMGLMAVVIIFHLTKLGIALNGDSSLFIVAVAVFFASLVIIVFEWGTISKFMSWGR